MSTHVVAMGGGGFSMSDDGRATALDRFLIDLTGKDRPTVCFAPTASRDEESFIELFRSAYGALGVRTTVLMLWEDAARSVEQLHEADLVVVGGGSSVNLMALWDAHGVSELLRARAGAGEVVLSGISAGGNCWFQGCVTTSFGPMRPWVGGLGLVAGSFCPHYDTEEMREPTFRAAVAEGILPSGYGCDEGAAVHFIDGRFHQALAERPGARTQRLSADQDHPDTVVADLLPATRLTPGR
ncbi:peptidase E [Arachnia propionica]|uniref:Peptidase E n=1 Tax=Arachnia propionica TaxID=1750 RepID=A0A3P1WUS5_9ACTN|nr:peptidase E [Arachnia propionica]RRD49557.1 peptidase E [Arachnia propionica]